MQLSENLLLSLRLGFFIFPKGVVNDTCPTYFLKDDLTWNAKWQHKKIVESNIVFSSVQFSHSVLSYSVRPHESQHARPPCPSPTPGVHSDSRPSSQWCRPAISSSVVPFSSCPQSLPASESFPTSQLFAWDGQSTGVSALASFLPKKSQGWSPSEWTGWISLQSKGLSRVFSNTTVQKHIVFKGKVIACWSLFFSFFLKYWSFSGLSSRHSSHVPLLGNLIHSHGFSYMYLSHRTIFWVPSICIAPKFYWAQSQFDIAFKEGSGWGTHVYLWWIHFDIWQN